MKHLLQPLQAVLFVFQYFTKEIFNFCQILNLSTSGSERVKKNFSGMQVHCRVETFKSELCIHFHGVHQQHTQSSCQVQFHIHLLTMFIKKVSVVPRMDSSPKVEV